jgi:membrane fusion protein, multidrug efflux system
MSTTALEKTDGDRHDQSLQDHPEQRLARNAGFRPSIAEPPSGDGEAEFVHARAPAPLERAPDERPVVDSPPLHDDRQPGHDETGSPPRGGLLRRHRFALMLGLALFVPAAAATYLYWDNAERFQSTDDSFIAARQFAIQPKVSGYITAVPVTDNQHVVAGDVIARIDPRD